MAVIQRRKGRKGVSYRVLIRMKAHSETRTFHSKDAAKRWAYETEDAYRSGKGPALAAGKETLEEAIDQFERNPARTTFKSHVRVVTMLREWESVHIGAPGEMKCLGDLPVGSITTERIEGICEEMLATVSPATVNRKRSALSVLYRTLAKKGVTNPVKALPMYKEPRGRIRYLSDEERSGLFAACRTPEVACAMLYSLVVVACYSGCRRGELMRLRWQDVNLSTGHATVLDTKNGTDRASVIAGPALEALIEWRAKTPAIGAARIWPQVFPQHAWQRALIVAGIKGFRFHDLRHTFASYLAMDSASSLELKEALGHKSLAMVARYAHLSPAHTASVVGRMAERFR